MREQSPKTTVPLDVVPERCVSFCACVSFCVSFCACFCVLFSGFEANG